MRLFSLLFGLSIFVPHLAHADDVRVRFDAPKGTELRWTPPDETESQVICVAPCADRRLSREGVYVAAPPNQSTSSAFQLEKKSGIELDVRPNRLGLVLGVLAITVGGTSIGMGTAMTINGHRAGGDSYTAGIFKVLGPTFITTGVVSLVAGVVTLFLDTGTKVHQHEQTRWTSF